MKILFYQTHSGNAPVEKYLESLDDHEAAPLYAALGDIELHGLEGSAVQLRVIQGKLWELKEDLDIAKARMKEVLAAE